MSETPVRESRCLCKATLIALFAATAVLGGGAQTLAPAHAVAMISEGEECSDPEWSYFTDCADANGGGGGGSTGGGSTTGGSTGTGSSDCADSADSPDCWDQWDLGDGTPPTQKGTEQGQADQSGWDAAAAESARRACEGYLEAIQSYRSTLASNRRELFYASPEEAPRIRKDARETRGSLRREVRAWAANDCESVLVGSD